MNPVRGIETFTYLSFNECLLRFLFMNPVRGIETHGSLQQPGAATVSFLFMNPVRGIEILF